MGLEADQVEILAKITLAFHTTRKLLHAIVGADMMNRADRHDHECSDMVCLAL
jgi:hypothetical protein